MPRPFAVIGFTLFLVLSLLTRSGLNAAYGVAALTCLLFVPVVLIKKLRESKVIITSMAACAAACLLFITWFLFAVEPVRAYVGEQHQIEAELTDSAVKKYGRFYYNATVLSVDGNKQKFKTRLSFRSALEADAYDRVSGKFMFYEPGASDDDTVSYLRAKGIYVAAYSEDEAALAILKPSEKPMAYSFFKIRMRIIQAVYDMLPNEYGGLIIAMLIGDKSGLSPGLLSAFRKAGTSHIICVSGLHLSIWALFILKIARKFKLNIKIASLVSAVATVAFMGLTGFPFSVVRAGIMTLLFLLANILSRESDSLNSLGFAVTVIMLINPFAAGDTSLKLSFLSTLGIVLGYRQLAPRIAAVCEKIRPLPLAAAVRYIALTAATTLCAAAFTLPVTGNFSGSFNFVCFAANIAAIFPSTLCMISSGAAVIVSFIPLASELKNIAIIPGGLAARFVAQATRYLADTDIFTVYFGDDLSRLWTGLVLILVSVSVIFMFKSGKGKVLLTSLLCAATFFAMSGIDCAFTGSVTEITAVDVGNGSAVLISRGRNAVLLGCGGDSFNASSEIIYALRNRNLNNIRLLLLPRSNDTESSCALDLFTNCVVDAVACDKLPMGCELVFDRNRALPGSFAETEVFDGVTVKSVCTDTCSYAVVRAGESRALVSFYPNSEIAQCDRNADILICRSDVPQCLNAAEYDLTVLTGSNKAIFAQNELLAGGVNACATAGNGNIVLKTRGDGLFAAYRER